MASIQQGPNGPVLVLKESALQQKGKDAQQNNIAAAKLVAQLVRSSLGPRGLDKMLVDSLGDVTITNDGATILKEIDVQHPAAKMMVEISKTVDNEVGDGTTSSVIFGGALLARAEDLLNKDVHSSTIIDGYQAAADKTLEIYSDLAKKIQPDDRASLLKIATTSMQSKLISEDSGLLSKIIVDAILSIATKKGDNYFVDLENIKVEKKAGGSIDDTQIIKGIVLDKEIVHSGMPTRIEKAKIALLNSALEIEKTELSSEIRITDPTQMQMFLEEENRMQHYLAKYGIMAVRRVKESDMIKLSKATGGRVISNIDDLSENDLGIADLAHQKKVESDKWVFIEGCKHPQSVTMLIRGGTQRVIDEVDRSIHDSLMVVKDVIEKPAIVAGGGAPEAFAASLLKDWADNFDGREQLAIKKYAEALETIPLTIAENAGMDPIDTMANLRAKQNQGQKWTGIDAKNMKIADMMGISVVEPIVVKEQIIKSATEAACMILRIDDVIAISGAPGGGGMPPMG
jgi:chaperonin GroEL (HSP60 family)